MILFVYSTYAMEHPKSDRERYLEILHLQNQNPTRTEIDHNYYDLFARSATPEEYSNLDAAYYGLLNIIDQEDNQALNNASSVMRFVSTPLVLSNRVVSSTQDRARFCAELDLPADATRRDISSAYATLNTFYSNNAEKQAQIREAYNQLRIILCAEESASLAAIPDLRTRNQQQAEPLMPSYDQTLLSQHQIPFSTTYTPVTKTTNVTFNQDTNTLEISSGREQTKQETFYSLPYYNERGKLVWIKKTRNTKRRKKDTVTVGYLGRRNEDRSSEVTNINDEDRFSEVNDDEDDNDNNGSLANTSNNDSSSAASSASSSLDKID